MFKNYLVTAIRNFWKNKLFSFINIFGLAIGLLVFVFATLFADYESHHDSFFDNAEHIYTIKTDINPASRLGVVSLNTVYTAVGPLIKQELPEIDKVARLVWTDLIINRGDVKFYQPVHMVDPEFLDIFHFEFVHGSPNASLKDNNSTIITEETAIRFFGRTDVAGETLTLNNQKDMRVAAVIKDLPLNSHLTGNMLDDERLGMLINTEVGIEIFNPDYFTNWSNLSISQRTYVLLPDGVSAKTLQPRLDGIIDRFGPDDTRDIVASIGFRPLEEMNLAIWDLIGIPGILIVRFLGVLVLVIACINFINLATAQALGRAREIGIRKTMGASRSRLAIQFLVESVVIALFALLIAIAIIEYSLPAFNSAFDKAVTFSYFSDPSMAAFLIGTVLTVGLFSGAFPAFLLARLDAAQALNGSMALGKWGLRLRKFLVISQNSFSVFLIVTVFVSFFQTREIKNMEVGFNHDDIELVLRTNREGINENYALLKSQFERLPGVLEVTGSSQYPFEQSNNQTTVSAIPGDKASGLAMNRIFVDYNFLETYQIPLIAGRQLSENFSNDIEVVNDEGVPQGQTNVIINALAARQLGWSNPSEALGKTVYIERNDNFIPIVIEGVSGNANFQGFHNEQKPFIYSVRPETFSAISVKYEKGKRAEVMAGLENTWNGILPEFPMVTLNIEDAFDDIFSIFTAINNALVGFAVMALLIATIGLFGLSAFMAERRIREVGVRKTFGASTSKIVKLLVFQFSRPVIWAVLFGWILAGLAYLGQSAFFANQPEPALIVLVFVFGGVFSLGLAWITVGANAYKAANTNPINSLHYE